MVRHVHGTDFAYVDWWRMCEGMQPPEPVDGCPGLFKLAVVDPSGLVALAEAVLPLAALLLQRRRCLCDKREMFHDGT